MYEVIIGACHGAITGVGYSIVGYAVAKTGDEGGSFQFYGLGKAMLAGALAGGVLGFGGVTIESYEQLMSVTLANMSVIALSQKVLHLGHNLLQKAKTFLKKD